MINAHVKGLLDLAGLPGGLATNAEITGGDPIFDTAYKVADAGAAAIAASGLSAAYLWSLHAGVEQRVSVDARAAAAAMKSNMYLKIDGEIPPYPSDEVTGFYPVKNGRWIFLHCNFANLRDRNLGVLNAACSRQSVAQQVAQWDGIELESAIVQAGGCAAFVRSEAEWNRLPAAHAAASAPIVELIKIGEAPPEPLPGGDRPLSGIRVLDLTRVLAGPTCGRTLAEHGADVLRVSRRGLPDSGMFDLDTGLGKLSTYLDLRNAAELDTLRQLIHDSDVFSQAYRPDTLARRGLSPEEIAALRPGIVYVTLSAWGHRGPWSDRRGFDTIVQAANGMAFKPDGAPPAFLPVAVQDYVAGYVMAFGAMAALARRAREGGSWMVRVSLASTGHWVREMGLLDLSAKGTQPPGIPEADLQALMMESDSPAGRLTHLAPVAHLSATPARWARPAVPLGTHPAAWPAR